MTSPSNVRAGGAFIQISTAGLGPAVASIGKIGTAMSGLGRKVLGISAILGAPFALGIVSAAKFERRMQNINTLLTESEGKSLPKFAQGIKDLAISTGQDITKIQDAFFTLKSAGIETAGVNTVLAQTAKLATAGFTTTEVAADALTSVLGAYGLSADKAGDASDFLFKTAKVGRTTFAEFAPTIGRVASIAKTAGVNLSELGGAFATVTQKGVGTRESITGLRSLFLGILKPSSEAKDVAKEFGIQLDAVSLRSKGLLGFLKQFRGISIGQLVKIFPNIRALTALLPIINDLNRFQANTAEISKRAGAAQEAFAKAQRSLAVQSQQLFRQIQVLGIEIGTALLPVMKDLVKDLSPIIKDFTRWAKLNPDVIKQIFNLTATLAILGATMIVVGGLISTVFSTTGAFGLIILASILVAEAFGLIDIGFSKMVNSISIGGVSLGNRIQLALLEIQSFILKINIFLGKVAGTFIDMFVIVFNKAIDLARNFGISFIDIIEKVATETALLLSSAIPRSVTQKILTDIAVGGVNARAGIGNIADSATIGEEGKAIIKAIAGIVTRLPTTAETRKVLQDRIKLNNVEVGKLLNESTKDLTGSSSELSKLRKDLKGLTATALPKELKIPGVTDQLTQLNMGISARLDAVAGVGAGGVQQTIVGTFSSALANRLLTGDRISIQTKIQQSMLETLKGIKDNTKNLDEFGGLA